MFHNVANSGFVMAFQEFVDQISSVFTQEDLTSGVIRTPGGPEDHGEIKIVSGRVGSCLNQIIFQYEDYHTKEYGDEGGMKLPRVTLQANEVITVVETTHWRDRLGLGIRFSTSKGRDFEFVGKRLYRRKTSKKKTKNNGSPSVTFDHRWECAPGYSVVDLTFDSRNNIIGIVQQRLPIVDKLPEGWQICVEPGSGKIFFVDTHTNTTHFELPEIRLPPGWEIAKTQDGQEFYVDHATQATYWDLPSANISSPAKSVVTGEPEVRPVVESDLRNEEDYECSICMDNRKTHACVPCGHKVLCEDCAAQNEIRECPICRTHVDNIIKIFD